MLWQVEGRPVRFRTVAPTESGGDLGSLSQEGLHLGARVGGAATCPGSLPPVLPGEAGARGLSRPRRTVCAGLHGGQPLSTAATGRGSRTAIKGWCVHPESESAVGAAGRWRRPGEKALVGLCSGCELDPNQKDPLVTSSPPRAGLLRCEGHPSLLGPGRLGGVTGQPHRCCGAEPASRAGWWPPRWSWGAAVLGPSGSPQLPRGGGGAAGAGPCRCGQRGQDGEGPASAGGPVCWSWLCGRRCRGLVDGAGHGTAALLAHRPPGCTGCGRAHRPRTASRGPDRREPRLGPSRPAWRGLVRAGPWAATLWRAQLP